MYNSVIAPPNGKLEKFLQELEKAGISLEESERYIKSYAGDPHRMNKSWETHIE